MFDRSALSFLNFFDTHNSIILHHTTPNYTTSRHTGQGQPSPSCSERKAASWQKAVGRLTAARDK